MAIWGEVSRELDRTRKKGHNWFLGLAFEFHDDLFDAADNTTYLRVALRVEAGNNPCGSVQTEPKQ